MLRAQVSFEEAQRFWQAREVYRLKRALLGLLLLVFALELWMEAAHGYWYVGVVLVALQYAALRVLAFVLRQAVRGVWWCVEYSEAVVRHWWQHPSQGGNV